MASFKKGTFTGDGATGDQSVTGVGFQPVALLIWSTMQTAAGLTDEYHYVEGWTDGTNQVTFFAVSGDNSASSVTRRNAHAARLIDAYSSAGTVVARATIVSFDSDGFTINWSTASSAIFHFVAIGGAGVEAEVGIIDHVSTIPALAFDPDVVFFNQGVTNGYTLGITTQNNVNNHGWVSRSSDRVTIGQGQSYCGGQHNAAAANTWRYQRTDRCMALGSGTSGAVDREMVWTQLGRSITVNGSSTIVTSAFLAIKGVRAFASTFNQPTSTGTQGITGVGFSPKCLFLMSVGQASQTTPQSEARLSRGAASGAGAQGHSWIGDLHAADPTVTARRHSETNLITHGTPNATGSSSTIDAEADLDSFDSDGFTLDWTTADATAREVLYLALGDAASGSTIAISIQSPAIVFPHGIAGY